MWTHSKLNFIFCWLKKSDILVKKSDFSENFGPPRYLPGIFETPQLFTENFKPAQKEEKRIKGMKKIKPAYKEQAKQTKGMKQPSSNKKTKQKK